MLTGTGDVLEPEAGVDRHRLRRQLRARRPPRALVDGAARRRGDRAQRRIDIAADICVYTNRNVTIESLKS